MYTWKVPGKAYVITDHDCGPRIVEKVGKILSSYDIIDRCLCCAHGRTKLMNSCVYKMALKSTSEKLNFQKFSFTYFVEERA